MKKVLRLLATALTGVLILSVLWLTASSITIEHKVSQAFEETNGSNNPFSIRIESADSYKITSVANIKVTVTNTSGTAIENVSAEALFDGLSPVGRNNTLKAETAILNSGESLSFSYSAMINKDNSKLNFFQKIILFFARLFKKGVSVSDNGFNDGRDFAEESKTIIFGKIDTRNTIKVWYDNKSISATTEDYEALIRGVDIDELYDYDDSDISVNEETGLKYINNIIILMFDDDCSNEERAKAINSINGKVVGGQKLLDTLYVEVSKNTLEELELICDRLTEEYKLDAFVDEMFYEEDIDSSSDVNDPYIIDGSGSNTSNFNNWNLSWSASNLLSVPYRNWYQLAIQAPLSWNYDNYFNSINIGIVDSGFQTNHEDLNIQVVSKKNSPKNHGTHVAGIIGATQNNGIGSAGIVKNKNLFGYAYHGNTIRRSGYFEGLVTLVDKYKCKVINYSQAFSSFLRNCKKEFEKKKIDNWGEEASKAISKLLKAGNDFIIVQSAGNGAADHIGVDSLQGGLFASITTDNCYSDDKITKIDIMERIIIVANVGFSSNGLILEKDSNKGSHIDVAAPGIIIYSTVAGKADKKNEISKGQKYAILSGTSMAAPIVTSIASLVWSVNPSFSAEEVKDIVCEYYALSAEGFGNDTRTYPIVNAKMAVEEAIRRSVRGTAKGCFVEYGTNTIVKEAKMTCVEFTGDISYFNLSDFDIDANSGYFNREMYAGNYKYIVTAPGMHEKDISFTVNKNKTTDIGRAKLISTSSSTTVSGTVKDRNTYKPIKGVSVDIIDNSANTFESLLTVKTDVNGQFSLALPVGSYSISFNHENYEYFGRSLTVQSKDIPIVLEDVLLMKQSSSGGIAISVDAVEYNGHHYRLYQKGTASTWEDAKSFCESMGGYLAVISSEEENHFLHNYILTQGIESAYFGFSDAETEGTWTWVPNEVSTYTNWHKGEPNHENANEDYAMFYSKYSDGTWNDGNFGNGNFICEWLDYSVSDENAPYWGDANNDKTVDFDDVIKLNNIWLGITDGTPEERCFLDVNLDGVLDGSYNDSDFTGIDGVYGDLLLLNQFRLGNTSSLPAKTLAKITFTKPTKTTYSKGESLNTSGMSVVVENKNDPSVRYTLSDNITVTGFDSSTAGIKHLIANYRGLLFRFDVTVTQSETPDDTIQFNGHYYKLFGGGMTWVEAQAYCENLGGHLVTITTESEQAFIQDLIEGKESRYWMGANKTNGKWTWVTGEAFEYTNWAKDEPNGSGNYLQMFNFYDSRWGVDYGLWDDCSSAAMTERAFICEWEYYRVADENAPYWGDINNDRKINVSDVTCLMNMLEDVDGVEEQFCFADVDLDGSVTQKDLELIEEFTAKQLVGTPFRFPAQDLATITFIKPAQTTYSKGELVDLCGMSIVIENKNDPRVRYVLNDNITVTGFDSSTVGIKALTAVFRGLVFHFDVAIV